MGFKFYINLFIYELNKPDKPNDCPSDWVAATGLTGAGSFCYKMVEGADTDFDGAETYCNGLGEVTGHTTSLISIEDAYEVSFGLSGPVYFEIQFTHF